MSDNKADGEIRRATNPYAAALGDRDTLAALIETPERIAAIVAGFTPGQYASSYAPGKWSAAELFLHLAQTELAFGMRVRMALTSDHYVVQPFDQDAWMARERPASGPEAFQAYYALRQFNLPLYRSLSADDRQRRLTHPERGEMVVQMILDAQAGHELHHLKHFETIAKG